MKLSDTSPFWVVLCFFLGSIFSFPEVAKAARFHVQISGTRTSGSSVANDWTPENCYSTLVSASNEAAIGDSILLYSETHFLDTAITLPSFLGNMDLDSSWVGTSIVCTPQGQLIVPAEMLFFSAKGVTIQSDGSDSHLSAFLLEGGFVSSSYILFKSCFFTENRGSDYNSGGGSCIGAQGSGNGALLEISNCLFTDNISRGRGGAVFVKNGYEVEVNNSDFLNNESRYGISNGEGRGAAIAIMSPLVQSRLHITNTRFNGNRSWGPGGTIFIEDGSLFLADSELNASESAVDFVTEWSAGAGIMVRRTESHQEFVFLTVERCLFDGNIGNLDTNPWAGDGGAILVKGLDNRYVDVNVLDCVFQNNYNAQGSGIYIGRFATGNVTRCRFLNNTAYLQGGASFKGGAFEANIGEAAIYSYCEFTGNRAGLDVNGNQSEELGRGGAFSTRLYPRGEFYNCTFYNNEAHGPWSNGDAIMLPNEGGIFESDLQRCVFVNTVFYGDVGNSLQLISRDGAISRVSNCAFEAGEVQTGGIADDGTIILVGNPFENSGHPFPGANSLLLDGALDTGQTMDILGNPVPFGDGPDIGAYERNGLVPVPENSWGLHSLSAWPNPFNPQTILKYEVNIPGSVRLEIFDVAGHKVKTLVQEYKPVGVHNITWQGKNEQGHGLPSGVYFARLQFDGTTVTSKLTLVR